MADLPIINPTKPLWPTRRDGKNPTDSHRKKDEDEADDKQKDKQIDEKTKTPPDSNDGHIDEYV